MAKGNMKSRKEISRYAVTLASSVTGNRLGGFLGPVRIQTSAAQSTWLQVSVFTVAGVIWEDLMTVLNHTAANMRGFLREMYGVQEEHHTMEKFDSDKSLSDLVLM